MTHDESIVHVWLSPYACLTQGPDAPAEVPEDAEDGHGKTGSKGEKAERVFIREYEAGRLLREDLVSAEEMEAVFGPFRRRARDKAQRRQRHRRRVEFPPTHTHTLLHTPAEQAFFALTVAAQHFSCERNRHALYVGLNAFQGPDREMWTRLCARGADAHCCARHAALHPDWEASKEQSWNLCPQNAALEPSQTKGECMLQAATRLGETIYKGHRSYDLMLNLQLGIRHSVQAYTKQPPVVQLENEHYTHKVSNAYIKRQYMHQPESVWGHRSHRQSAYPSECR